MRKDTQWQFAGDVSWSDYGGKWFRRTTGRRFQVIELTNMNDAVGERDNEGYDTYVVGLSLVDLDAISADQQASAIRSCGPDDAAELTDAWRAVVCYEFGCKAPLDSWSGNGYSKLLRAARSAAHALKRDALALTERLSRPVNKIGSTAAEYMIGDIRSAVLRGVSEGNPAAELMLKLGV